MKLSKLGFALLLMPMALLAQFETAEVLGTVPR